MEKTVAQNWAPIVSFVGGLLALGGLGIIVLQCGIWLHSGAWAPVPTALILALADAPYPRTDWVGAQRIIDAALEIPASITLILSGVGIAGSAVFLE